MVKQGQDEDPEIEELIVPNGTTPLQIEDLTEDLTVLAPQFGDTSPSREQHGRNSEKQGRNSTATPTSGHSQDSSDSSNDVEFLQADSAPAPKRSSSIKDSGPFHNNRGSNHRSSVASDMGISDQRKPRLRHGHTVAAANCDYESEDGGEDAHDSRTRRSIVGPLGGHGHPGGHGASRPSRRASFAMQMLLPMHNFAAQTDNRTSNSRRTSAVDRNQPNTDRRPSALNNQQDGPLPPPIRGGTRHMSILTPAPPPHPRSRARSSSFALNNTSAIQGFQAQLNEHLNLQEDRGGRKKSLVRSRTSVAGLDSLVKQINAKEPPSPTAQKDEREKEQKEHKEKELTECLSDSAIDQRDIEARPPARSPELLPPRDSHNDTAVQKPVTKTATITDERDDISHHSDSEESSGSDHGLDEKRTADTGDSKTEAPAGRRFTRLLPSGKTFVRETSDGGRVRPWIFTSQANVLFGSLILINAAYIGIETDFSDHLPSAFWLSIEILFVTAFTIELVLRMKHHKQAPIDFDDEKGPFWKSGWNVMDFCIVVVGIVDTLIMTVFMQVILGLEVDESDRSKLSFVRTLRVIRVLRLLRVLRIFRFLRELLLLASGILVAIKALVWAMMLVFLTLYTSSIIATRFIGQDVDNNSGSEDDQYLYSWFGTVPSSMFTLFQLMTLEDWSTVARLAGETMGIWCYFFFVIFVIITNWVLLNLVTGVILENVLAISKREEEKALQKEEAHRMQTVFMIHNLFDTVLGDRETDELTIEEFRAACMNPRVVRQLAGLQIATYEAEELFVLMDTAKRGAINIDHFIEGCLRIRGAARAKHLLAVQFDVQKVWSKLSDQFDEVEDRLVLEVQRNATECLDLMQEYMEEIMPTVVKEALTEAYGDGIQESLIDALKDATKELLQDFGKGMPFASTETCSSAVRPQASDTASSSAQAWRDASASKEQPKSTEVEECVSSTPPPGHSETITSEDFQSDEGADREKRASSLIRSKSLVNEELHKLIEEHEEHDDHHNRASCVQADEHNEDSGDEQYADPTALRKSEPMVLEMGDMIEVPAQPPPESDVPPRESEASLLGVAEAKAIVATAVQSPLCIGVSDAQAGSEGTSSRSTRKSAKRNTRKSTAQDKQLKDVASRLGVLHREEDGLLRRLATCRDNRNSEVSMLSRILNVEDGTLQVEGESAGKKSISFQPKLSNRQVWDSKSIELPTVMKRATDGHMTDEKRKATLRQSVGAAKGSNTKPASNLDCPEPCSRQPSIASPSPQHSISLTTNSLMMGERNKGRSSLGFGPRTSQGGQGQPEDTPSSRSKRHSSQFNPTIDRLRDGRDSKAPLAPPRPSAAKLKSWND